MSGYLWKEVSLMAETEKVVIVGFGEVGRPILELVSKHEQAFGVDVSPPAERIEPVDVLHICYPCGIRDFIDETSGTLSISGPL